MTASTRCAVSNPPNAATRRARILEVGKAWPCLIALAVADDGISGIARAVLKSDETVVCDFGDLAVKP